MCFTFRFIFVCPCAPLFFFFLPHTPTHARTHVRMHQRTRPGRIGRIIKLDQDVQSVTKEATALIGKAMVSKKGLNPFRSAMPFWREITLEIESSTGWSKHVTPNLLSSQCHSFFLIDPEIWHVCSMSPSLPIR